MSELEKNNAVNSAKGLAKWFKLEITLSIFDHVILHWVYPPQKSTEK